MNESKHIERTTGKIVNLLQYLKGVQRFARHTERVAHVQKQLERITKRR